MMYFASKTNNSLNGLEYSPELLPIPVCVNPYYNVQVKGEAPFMIDSGAFQDVSSDSRLSFEDALNRQLEFEKTLTPDGRPAYGIVSYDRLVDEQYDGNNQFKDRVSYEVGEDYVAETVAAAKYLSSKRDELRPRKLILSCQGTTTEQYIGCLKEILKVATPDDIIGLGGFCIISKSKRYKRQFYEVINQAFPLIAEHEITRVHIFGVGIISVLVQADVLGRTYGIECSYDTSSYEVNAVFGRIFDPDHYQLTNTFTKRQKKNGYVPPILALFNISMVKDFWIKLKGMPIPDKFYAGLED